MSSRFVRVVVLLAVMGSGFAVFAAAPVGKGPQPTVEVLDPRDIAELRKAGVEAVPMEPGQGSIKGWPSITEREGFLKAAPKLADFAKKNKWDGFETDRFIFRAKMATQTSKDLRRAYPAVPADVIEASLAVATAKK